MAIIRDNLNPDYPLNHIATLAFFCCVSCVILMLKFGGFKASLTLYNGRKKNKENNNNNKESEISMNGAYRTNRDEFFAHNPNPERQRKLTPSLSPPIVQTEQSLRGAKSTSDLIKNKNLPPNLRQSNPNISQDPRGEQTENTNKQSQEPKKEIQKLDAEKRIEKRRQEEEKKLNKQRIEDQKKWEKQRAENQRKTDKQAAQEHAKEGKLRKEQQKKDLQLEKKRKRQAPTMPLANPLAQPKPHSTNTLESSISRSSGPPPYTETLKPESVKNQSSSSGDISFSKPIDTGSWDLISQHRQQINRPVTTQTNRKQMVMDLKYMANDKVDESRDNSEA